MAKNGKTKQAKGNNIYLSDLNLKTEIHIDAPKAMYLAIKTLNNCTKATEKAIDSIAKLADIQVSCLNVNTKEEDSVSVSHAHLEGSFGNTIGAMYKQFSKTHKS